MEDNNTKLETTPILIPISIQVKMKITNSPMFSKVYKAISTRSSQGEDNANKPAVEAQNFRATI